MKYSLGLIIVLFLILQGNLKTNAQNPIPAVISTTKVDDLTDSQIRDIMAKSDASGMSDDQLHKAAISNGMSEGEFNKLQARIATIRSTSATNTAKSDLSTGTDARQLNLVSPSVVSATMQKPKTSDGLAIFGSDLFNNENLTFEPNLRIPTPQNYLLGPDDQVIINVYGNSQVEWKLNISPDGSIQIPGVGMANISGKTIEQATALIKSKLIANSYAIGHGTSVNVTLGNIRSIKVIIDGEVTKPGTYTLTSLSTVFNALYASGGPSNIGSYRKIELIRDNRVIKRLDVYDFILKGSQTNNMRLQDGDIIRVPTYQVRVSLAGEVKHSAIFEVLPGEHLQDVINFAGGFTDKAYTASIKAVQLTDKEYKVTDIPNSDFNNYIPLRGDAYTVDPILNRFENRVTISGAVFRPGQFELETGLTLSQLIVKASGLKEDAYMVRGYINRLKADNTLEIIPFNVRSVLNKSASDILLKREDMVVIPSIFDLRDDYIVTVTGDVRKGGNFNFVENMSVEDLILQAGGFAQGASTNRIEIARRVENSDPNGKFSAVAQLFTINVNSDLSTTSSSFKLQPFDIVSIYSLPGYEKQKNIRVEGEVLYPGNYTISTKNEKISDLIKRAGGLTVSGDLEGSTLKRTNILGIDADKGKVNAGELEQERNQRIQQLQKTFRDSSNLVQQQLRNDFVGIDLKKILDHPGSDIDLIVEDGDIIRVPKQQQIVKVNGEVLFPSSVLYTSSKTLRGYINNAGGFSPNALRRRVYVVYSNGTVKGTRKFLFFNNYPKIKPGSDVIVPKKTIAKGLSTAESIGLLGSVVSLGAIILGIINVTKK